MRMPREPCTSILASRYAWYAGDSLSALILPVQRRSEERLAGKQARNCQDYDGQQASLDMFIAMTETHLGQGI